MTLQRFRRDGDKRPREIPWRRWLVLCLFIGTGAVAVGVMLAWPGADKVASESGCKSTGRFAASWVSIRAGELK